MSKFIAAASTLIMGTMLLAACGSSDSSDDFVGVTWEWKSLAETAPASRSVVPEPQNYDILFTDEDLYDATADCNMVGGSYERSGDDLTLSAGPSTRAFCGEESLSEQYIALLLEVDGFRLDDGELVLTYGGGAGEMTFAEP